MKHRIFFLVTFFVAMALSADAPQDKPPGFAQVLPNAIKWIPSPLVPGTYRAVLLGNPDEAGPFVMRVKVPPGARIMPHTHRDERECVSGSLQRCLAYQCFTMSDATFGLFL